MRRAGLWIAPILTSIEVGPTKRAPSKSQRKPAVDGYALKLNGKVVSDMKLQLRAFPWVAENLMQRGKAGGIVDLLLPSCEEQLHQLASDRERYSLEAVRSRDGGRRRALRDQAMSPALLVQLIAICQAQPGWKKQQFVEWLVDQIKIKGSPARNVIATQAPNLLLQMRGYGWWYRLLGAKKMSR